MPAQAQSAQKVIVIPQQLEDYFLELTTSSDRDSGDGASRRRKAGLARLWR